MRKILFFIMLCLTIGANAHDRLMFRNLDVRSGISDNYVQSILRDRYGFMWFATLNGLNCYDGYRFKKYTITQFGSYNNDMEFITEDADGHIWIKGPVSYYRYDREQDKLEDDLQPVLNGYGIAGEVGFLTVDKDYNLWCVVADTLYYYDFSQRKLCTFSLPKKKKVEQLACRSACAYVLFSDGEIARIDLESQTIVAETRKILRPGLRYTLYIDTIDRLWFYASHTSGLQCYGMNPKQWISYIGQQELASALITTVMDDGNGNLWIGTDDKGIYVSFNKEKQLVWMNKQPNNPFSLADNHINCFFKDNRNTMWVGTGKQGVSFACLNDIAFSTHLLPGQEDVKCLQEDKEGNLWLGFDGEGLACQKVGQDSYTRFRMKEHAIPSDLIICSCLDSRGRMWFGTYGGGVFYEQGGKFVPFHYDEPHSKDAPLNDVRRIVEDENGTLWFGTFVKGLYAMDAEGNFAAYTMDSSILRTGSIMDLAYSGGRNLYVGTSSGLYAIDIYSRKIVSLTGNKAGTQSFPDSYVNCLFRDSRGLLWIGARNGMNVLDEQKDEIVQLTTENGLSHNCIRAIAEDKYGNLWVTTDCGITHVVVTADSEKALSYVCHPYFEEDGVGSMTFNTHAITCDKQGEILMGGIGRYLRVTPKSAGFYRQAAHSVVFTGLILANRKMEVGSHTSDGRVLLQKNIQLLDEITLDYSDRNFALEVSSMDYLNRHKLQFAYRLDRKGEWVRLEGNRILFNRLSSGTFRLSVKVYEPDGCQDNPVSSLVIHIRPPFWLSPMAYVAYLLFVVALFLLILRSVHLKHKRLMKQQRHEMEITQQHEMDEAKMRFFTNVSHDLRTPLALIITPLEKLLSSGVPQNLKKDLELMHRNSVALLNEVNQLLDFRKLDKQKAQLSLSYGNLADFVKETCGAFSELSMKNGIHLELVLKETDISMSFDRNKMQRILLNLLSNAIKYNKANGSVLVTVSKVSTPEGEQASIQVADTGIGIKNKEKVFDRFFQEQHATGTYVGSGIGLHIVKEYVTLHGGTVSITDNMPEGSIFILTFPLIGNAEQNVPSEKETSVLPAEYLPVEKIQEDGKQTDGNTSILIVEDNDDFRHFLTGCLAEHFKVLEASNGKEALEILSQEPAQMVISDVMMPVMDGMELCHAIKTDIRFSHIPIILLTARTAEEHVLSGLKEGADDYVTKPFNLEILLIRINKILSWTQNNHKKFKTVDVSPSEITISSLDEQLMEKAIRIVEENMDNSEFSVEELSAQIGLSRSSLYKKLISITGKSPLEFMRILRLKRGKQLLEKSQLSISQVAYQIGFSPKQFAKYFKEEFGCLPSEYKNRT
ncbi:MAG: two-component regulator propeller domain-containing protein [Bacteroidales bacterium]|nr:two-component regulator propeller domain-containing protein [Bacteroidales bacterium]